MPPPFVSPPISIAFPLLPFAGPTCRPQHLKARFERLFVVGEHQEVAPPSPVRFDLVGEAQQLLRDMPAMVEAARSGGGRMAGDPDDWFVSSLAFITQQSWVMPTAEPSAAVAVRAAAAVEGLVLEFGVWEGKTISDMATRFARLQSGGVGQREIHGFDSFLGLPHAWEGRGMPQGRFSTGGTLPDVPPNVHLHKGWFNDTLPVFLREIEEGVPSAPSRVALVHMDANLYSSTREVLDMLLPWMRAGTVVWFDDYLHHAVRAFHSTSIAVAVLYVFELCLIVVGPVPCCRALRSVLFLGLGDERVESVAGGRGRARSQF